MRTGKQKTLAFTLAEVLITVMIIGIVAAISIPSLIENVSERIWDSQRKVLHLRLSEALSMLPKLDGYTYTSGSNESDPAEVFVTQGLASVYKMGGFCTSDMGLDKCGLPDKIVNLDGSSQIDFPTSLNELNSAIVGDHRAKSFSNTVTISDTNAVAFKTTNGESIAVFYYPYCKADGWGNYSTSRFYQMESIPYYMCVNFIYDLNGSEGPNQMGKDIGFITAFYKKNPVVVAPIPYISDSGSADYKTGVEACIETDDDLRLPTKDELSAMLLNSSLLNLSSKEYWSGTVYRPSGSLTAAWSESLGSSSFVRTNDMEITGNSAYVRCVYD